jgi:hypothetical protein
MINIIVKTRKNLPSKQINFKYTIAYKDGRKALAFQKNLRKEKT